MSATTAIILAGGERDAVCKADTTVINKAFLSVGGSPLVTRVLRALRETNEVGRIIVVAPEGAPAAPLMLADERRNAGPRITDSLLAGFADLPHDQPVLVCSADLPLLSPNGTDDFLISAQASEADLCYGYLERIVHESIYPTLSHTWVRLKGGVYCGAGLSTLKPRALPALLAVIERLAAGRKSPWRMASLFGPRVLIGYILGTLSIGDLQSRASTILDYPARGILTPHPELAVNIDSYDDLLRVEQIICPPATSRRFR